MIKDEDIKDKGSVYEPLELDRSQLTHNLNISIRNSSNSICKVDLFKKDEFYPFVYKEETINLNVEVKSETKTKGVDLLTKESRNKPKKTLSKRSPKLTK